MEQPESTQNPQSGSKMFRNFFKRVSDKTCVFSALVFISAIPSSSSAIELESHPKLEVLIKELAGEKGLDPLLLENWLRSANFKQSIIDAITRPAEGLPWHRYRQLFVTDGSVKNGVKFMKEHADTLKRAEQKYGVPAEVITAIIGIETRFGTVKGNHRVLDSLTTLAVGYPRRSKFFTKELREYLILVHENNLDPLVTKGSYAGAIGIPQFMPSSYRYYSVDFNNDGVRNLVDDFEDAIGSVGAYLAQHKWRRGEPVSLPLSAGADEYLDSLHTRKLKANTDISKLARAGLEIGDDQKDWKVGVIKLQDKQGDDYRVGYHNYFVITTYNRSQLYAMAAHELSQRILKGMN